MYQTGKGLPAWVLGPKDDKLMDLKIDDYDAAGRFILVVEKLRLLGF